MSMISVGINDDDVAMIVDEMNGKGFAVIPDYVTSDDLGRMRKFVAATVQASNGEYRGFVGPDEVSGSGLDELARSGTFRDMMDRIYQRAMGQSAPPQDFYQVLRCLTGQTAVIHSNRFHYDSYVITMLIPVEIPTSGQTGDFLLIPNTRKIRSHYFMNVLDKILLDNKITQFALRKLTQVGLVKMVRLKLVPGNAYFFWGYRTIHTNDPCDPDKVRATALFHYVNPHADADLPFRRLRPSPAAAPATQ